MRNLMESEIVSFTTREKREGESNGKDYIFISKEEYFDLLDANKLIEWTEYGGNYYGITKQELEDKLEKDHSFAIVDSYGMEQLLSLHPKCVSVFIYTSIESAREQMMDRGDRIENIENRMSTYEKEMKNKKLYDYVIRNNHRQLDRTIAIVENIIKSET